jgi:hypothetical protein
MRKFLGYLAFVLGFAVVVGAIFIEPFRIEVTHSVVPAPLNRPVKIAQLSDLHTEDLPEFGTLNMR